MSWRCVASPNELYDMIALEKKALIFGLDDVLFPKKDYLLQVYYLFANLLEYTETVPPASELTEFLKTAYQQHGESGLFERAARAFGIDPKYRASFHRLHLDAKLPLKLWIHKPIKEILNQAQEEGKSVFLLVTDNPAMQLNKLRHMEWEGLDQVVKVYFAEEIIRQQQDPVRYLLAENGLQIAEVTYIHAADENVSAMPAELDCLDVERILTA